tara:strand:- start:314 stop:952 length:639 start_codon:yes stop_codon:yes gene_type:complete
MAKKVDWSKAPKLNTKERGDFYKKNNLKMDNTTKVTSDVPMGGFTKPTAKKPKGQIAPKLNEIKPSSTYVDRINVSQAKKASDNNSIDLYKDARDGMRKTRLKTQQQGYDRERREVEDKDKEGMTLSQRNKYDTDKTTKAIKDFRDNDAPGMYNKSKSKVEQDYARNAIHDFKSGKKSEGNYEKKKELEVASGEGYSHSGHKVNKHSKKNRS